MLDNEKEDQFNFDEVVSILNTKNRELKPLLINTKQEASFNEKNDPTKETIIPKTLLFKPWSGKEFVLEGDTNYIIKEQIQGIEEKDEDE